MNLGLFSFRSGLTGKTGMCFTGRGLCLAAFLCLALSCKGPASPAGAEIPWRPLNIVVVTIDTLRADRLGCYGYPNIETPHLDQLARNGALFENAVAQSPLTPPSHASMFTGTYPPVHQVRATGGFILDSGHETLAEILQQQGWQTAAFVGSAVLGRVFGLDQGFQTYDDQISQPAGDPVSANRPERRAGQVVDRAVEWLQGQSGKNPIFLWVHVYDPHAPYDPPAPFNKAYQKSPYDGEIAYTDRELGRLFSAVAEKLPAEQTVVTILSDHGESLSEHGEYAHGVFLYDSTLRIPWIMSGAGIPRGTRVLSQARTIDLLPTLLDMLQGETPAVSQGASLVPAFSGQPVDTTYSYAESLFPKINMGWAELRAIRTNKWKYIRAPQPELYDLGGDPGEVTNVIEQFPLEARNLEKQLRKLVSAASEQVSLRTLDREVEEQLRSLGYVSSGTPAELELTGEGIDPKDRVHVLKLIEESTSTQKSLSSERRLQLLRQALQEDPTNPSLYFLLGEAYEKTRRDSQALQVYQAAIEQGGTATNQIYARLAGIYGRQGHVDLAIASFRKAVEIDPTDLETQNRLAVAYLLSGRLAEAERILQVVLKLNDRSSQAHNSLGWVALRKNDLQGARARFERALELDPSLLEAYINLGMLYKQAGDYARARSSFEAFLAQAQANQHQDSIARVKRELAALPQAAGGGARRRSHR